ncbi:neuropeptide Y receptor type 2-like [Montipora capricornis]|uniref:neuropeptide Y receptor type 2-like n=1 Tax=Montipora capricornis TaxID=246305 RepID=UPI0035F1C5D6
MTCYEKAGNESTNATNSSLFSLAPEPEALRIARVVVFGVIAALALVGNFVVCRAVWRDLRPKPFAHFLVSNLAFAEIISMVCLLFTFHAYEVPYSWELGPVACKILDPLQVASLMVVTTTLAILAVYRCVVLIKPTMAKTTNRQTCCVIVVTWVGSLGMSIPAGHFRLVNSYGPNCDIHQCEETFPKNLRHHQNTYSIILFVINFAIPLLIMAVSYSLIYKKIREHIFVLKRARDESCQAFSSVIKFSVCEEKEFHLATIKDKGGKGQVEFEHIIDINEDKNQRRQQGKEHHRQSLDVYTKNTVELENDLLKLVFVLVFIFVVCYVPYQVHFLMIEFNVEALMLWRHRYTLSRVVFTLTCFPSALHPICYGTMSKFYHRTFLRMIACRDHKPRNV